MNRVQLSTAALLSLGLVGVAACDHGTSTATSAEFRQADANHDGRLSSDEYKHLLAIQAAGGNAAAAKAVKSNLQHEASNTRFNTLDSNRDGFISPSEYRSY